MEIIQRPKLLNPTPPIGDGDNYIPDWLLFEILLRLPLNSVIKCRAVSKRWLSAASAPYFIRAYACRASSLSRPPWLVLPGAFYPRGKFLPLVHNPSNSLILRELYLHPPQCLRTIQRAVQIVGVSDGLVLCCTCPEPEEIKSDLCVCNLVTGDRTEPVTLQLPYENTRLGWGFLTRVDQEFTLQSYRIVRAMEKPNDNSVTMFYVYYSETGDWKKFTVALGNVHLLDLQESAAALDGILYWADSRDGGVIAYDPEAKPEQARLIRGPHGEWKPSDELYACLCVANRGELRYFGGFIISYYGIPGFKIWKLEGFTCGSGEWRLLHEIDGGMVRVVRNGDLPGYEPIEIMCYDPFDSDVVYFLRMRSRSILSYNLRSGALEDRPEMIVGDKKSLRARSYRFPWSLVLVLPPWVTVVAEKQHSERSRGWF